MTAFPLVSCMRLPGRILEYDSYITPDGVEVSLNQPGVRAVISDTGSGMPPLNYITERGPFQHGVSLKGVYLQPRVIQMIVRQNFLSRIQWYQGKAALVNALRPNRTVGKFTDQTVPSQGVLRKYMPDGSKLDLHVLIQQGPKFEPRITDGWDEWGFQETLQFIAFDPIYFNPTARTLTLSPAGLKLVFPITFPISFSTYNLSGVITYLGTWDEFPIITMTGPLTNVTITNVTTNQVLQLNYAIPAGRVVTINLEVGQKTVTLDDGTNLVPYLTANSALASWVIAPAPEAAGGVNNVTVASVGGSGTTTFTWHDRYITLQLPS